MSWSGFPDVEIGRSLILNFGECGSYIMANENVYGPDLEKIAEGKIAFVQWMELNKRSQFEDAYQQLLDNGTIGTSGKILLSFDPDETYDFVHPVLDRLTEHGGFQNFSGQLDDSSHVGREFPIYERLIRALAINRFVAYMYDDPDDEFGLIDLDGFNLVEVVLDEASNMAIQLLGSIAEAEDDPDCNVAWTMADVYIIVLRSEFGTTSKNEMIDLHSETYN